MTSTLAAMISPPPSTRPAMGARSSTSRSQAMTRAPSLASDRAMVWPMPRAAPATIAVRPSNRMSMDCARSLYSAQFVPAVSFRLQITASEITAEGNR